MCTKPIVGIGKPSLEDGPFRSNSHVGRHASADLPNTFEAPAIEQEDKLFISVSELKVNGEDTIRGQQRCAAHQLR